MQEEGVGRSGGRCGDGQWEGGRRIKRWGWRCDDEWEARWGREGRREEGIQKSNAVPDEITFASRIAFPPLSVLLRCTSTKGVGAMITKGRQGWQCRRNV